MFERLVEIDHDWLLAINSCHAPWADSLMWAISAKETWIPLYILLVILLVRIYRRATTRHRVVLFVGVVLAFVVAVGGADMISHAIKHTVCRLRPTHHPLLGGLVHVVNGYTGGLYGFVSSHAANTMACALLVSLIGCRRKQPSMLSLPKWLAAVLMGWVMLNSYSRIYLGVHYPADIIGGWIVGALTAYGAFCLLRVWEQMWNERCDYSPHASAEADLQAGADDEATSQPADS